MIFPQVGDSCHSYPWMESQCELFRIDNHQIQIKTGYEDRLTEQRHAQVMVVFQEERINVIRFYDVYQCLS